MAKFIDTYHKCINVYFKDKPENYSIAVARLA